MRKEYEARTNATRKRNSGFGITGVQTDQKSEERDEFEGRSRRDGEADGGLREALLQVTQAPAYAANKMSVGASDARNWVEQARNLPKLLSLLPTVFKESKAFLKAEDRRLSYNP